jgi:hypothetical protein
MASYMLLQSIYLTGCTQPPVEHPRTASARARVPMSMPTSPPSPYPGLASRLSRACCSQPVQGCKSGTLN